MKRRKVGDPVSPVDIAVVLGGTMTGLAMIVWAEFSRRPIAAGIGLLLAFTTMGVAAVWRFTGTRRG